MDALSVNNAVVAVVLLPMVAGILGMVLRERPRVQRASAGVLLGASALASAWLTFHLPESGVFVSAVGDWPPPYAIVLGLDALSGTLIACAGLVGAICLVGASGERGDLYETGWLAPMLSMLVFGVHFSFLTGDLFNLFVAFEIMLMGSYALVLRNASTQGVKQAHKYVMLNLFASSVFVLAAGLVYGTTGTLNIADLARFARDTPVGELPVAFTAAGVMLLFVFALKAALFPLWFWLPDTYHTLPVSVGGLFAALLSKVGLYALLRVIVPVFSGALEAAVLDGLLALLAGATMVLGGLCALGVPTLRRVMSFVLVAHMGMALFMVSLGTPGALGAAGFLLAQEMFVIGGLFLVGAACARVAGTDDLRRIAELHAVTPWLSRTSFVLVIAGCGLPPTSAFVAKAWMVQEGARAGAWWLTGAMLVSALLMTLALVRAWAAVFWRVRTPTVTHTTRIEEPERGRWLTVSAMIMAGCVVAISVASPVLYRLMEGAGRDLSDPSGRIIAVLGEREGGARP